MKKQGFTEARFEPYTKAFTADPYRVYARLREHSAVFYSAEFGMTFLARYRDIFDALTDRRLGREPLADETQTVAGGLPNYDRYVRVNLLETEGETHARLRKLLSRALSPRRIAGLQERVQQIASALIEPLASGSELDFIAEVAEPLPVTVISELLGWPQSERPRLRPWSSAIVRLYEKDATEEDAMRAEKACAEFAAMLDALATERKASPADDFISAAVAFEDEPGGLSRDELVSSCMLLLNAGHEATVNAAGNGLLALLDHPEAMEKLRSQPSLVEPAVEEMLRYDPPLHLFHRFAYEEVNIAGHVVPRGAKVGLLYGSANRDPEMFTEPDRFDIERSPNRHLSFGAATHFCLGAPLARLELRTLFTTLLARTRKIELTGPTPQHAPGLVFRSLKHLAIRTQ
ncbi:MAG TPA: cytochrome P450 [Woeseiaceae bacterium]|nr:cytochrome P450 [Woeseiaceae bacterium]